MKRAFSQSAKADLNRFIQVFCGNLKANICLLVFLISLNTQAQPSEKLVKVAIAPDHADWVYNIGDQVKFKVMVTCHNEMVQNVKIR